MEKKIAWFPEAAYRDTFLQSNISLTVYESSCLTLVFFSQFLATRTRVYIFTIFTNCSHLEWKLCSWISPRLNPNDSKTKRTLMHSIVVDNCFLSSPWLDFRSFFSCLFWSRSSSINRSYGSFCLSGCQTLNTDPPLITGSDDPDVDWLTPSELWQMVPF